jgi:hypothetical protein
MGEAQLPSSVSCPLSWQMVLPQLNESKLPLAPSPLPHTVPPPVTGLCYAAPLVLLALLNRWLCSLHSGWEEGEEEESEKVHGNGCYQLTCGGRGLLLLCPLAGSLSCPVPHISKIVAARIWSSSNDSEGGVAMV